MSAALEDSDAGVRSAVAVALGKIGREAALQPLIRQLEDSDAGVRRAALEALLMRSHQEAVLLSEDVDGLAPFLEPADPITDTHASNAAAKPNLTLEEIRVRYEALAAEYHIELAWRTPKP